MKVHYKLNDLDDVNVVLGQQIKYYSGDGEFSDGVVLEIILAKTRCDVPYIKLRDCFTNEILVVEAFKCNPEIALITNF